MSRIDELDLEGAKKNNLDDVETNAQTTRRLKDLSIDAGNIVEVNADQSGPVFGDKEEEQMRTLLPKLLAMDYWSAEYQAAEPFIKYWLTNGEVTDLAEQYLEIVTDKFDPCMPERIPQTKIFEKFRFVERSYKSLLFEDTTAAEVASYRECIESAPISQVMDLLQNEQLQATLLYNLLKKGEGKLYSPDILYAVYLYRNGSHRYFDVKYKELRAELKRQLQVYTEEYCKMFDKIRGLINSGATIAEWYCDTVRDVISRAWSYGADLDKQGLVMTTSDLYNLPHWASTQLRDYILNLPVVHQPKTSNTDIFNAIMYLSAAQRQLDDPNLVFFFALDLKQIGKMYDKILEDVESIVDESYIEVIRTRYKMLKSQGVGLPFATAEDYDVDLASRGFKIPYTPTFTFNSGSETGYLNPDEEE